MALALGASMQMTVQGPANTAQALTNCVFVSAADAPKFLTNPKGNFLRLPADGMVWAVRYV